MNNEARYATGKNALCTSVRGVLCGKRGDRMYKSEYYYIIIKLFFKVLILINLRIY